MGQRASITIGLCLDEERELRKILIDKGLTISQWGRQKVHEEILKARKEVPENKRP